MATSRRDSVGLLLEGVVILVSILAAFFLEGWRDDRELARELTQELSSLQRELVSNRDLMSVHLESLDRIALGGQSLVDLLDTASEAEMVLVADTLAWIVNSFVPSLNPSLGAVEALIASGRLAQIRNPDLRLGLAGLRDFLSDAIEEEMAARQVTVQQLMPLIRTHFDSGETERIGREFFGAVDVTGLSTQERTAGRALQSYQSVAYPNSLAIRNTIRFKLGWYEVGRLEYGRLIPHMDGLIEMVGEEIR